MARAGFCTECGDNVFLTDEGACPEGHGAECIRDEYEVEDETAAVAGEAEASEGIDESEAEAAQDEHVTPSAPTAVGEVAPQRNRTGLAVFAAAAVLLLIALIAGAFALFPALNKSKTPAPAQASGTAKARVEVAISFLNALFADDTAKIKPLLTDEAQNAITAEQWDTIASSFPTVTVTFDKATWSSDTTAVVAVTTEDATATLSAGVSANSTDTVNVELAVQGNKERATLTLTKTASGWRILSIADETGGATLYDDAFVKSLYDEAKAQ